MEEAVKKPESIIIDTNVLISSIVKQDGYTQALLSILFVQKHMKLAVPESIKREIEAHKNEISRKSGLPLNIIREILGTVFECVDTAEERAFLPEIREALELVLHEEDAPFAGLALQLRPSIILTYNKRHFKKDELKIRDVIVLEPGELADYLDMVIRVDKKVKRKGGILKLISKLYLLRSKGKAGTS